MNHGILTVLIVDDVEENVILLTRLLGSDKYRVHSAFDGRQAITTLENEKIDLVILDINMPVVDGITVLKNIKSNSDLATIPVIMLTALDDLKTTMECMRLGACGYVTKPYNMDSLHQQIENCVSQT